MFGRHRSSGFERAIPLCGYASHFPALDDPRALTFEATPDTVWRAPDAVRWVSKWLPDTKLLALVRDPVERAFSQWRFGRKLVAHSKRPRCAVRRAKLLALLDRDPYFAFEGMVDRAIGRQRLRACGLAPGQVTAVTPTMKSCAKKEKVWKLWESLMKDRAVFRRVAAAAKARGRPAPRARWDVPFFGGGSADTCKALAEAGGGDPLRCYVFACSNRVLADDIIWVGQYSNGLRPWFSAFPREQIYVVRTEDLETRTKDTVDEVVSFLGLPAADFGQDAFTKRCPVRQGIKVSAVAKARGGAADNTDGCASSNRDKRADAAGVARYAGIPGGVRRRLEAHYAPFNRELEALVDDGRPFWQSSGRK